jgi:hypothetical protein
MKLFHKTLIAGAALATLGTATVVQSMAQSRPVVGTDLYAVYGDRPYSGYQAPDGSYYSLSDYTRSVEGTPCGTNCTRRAQERQWSR